MSKYLDREAVANKIDWEGGVYSWLQYGMTASEMPDRDTYFAAVELENQFSYTQRAAADFMALLPDVSSE